MTFRMLSLFILLNTSCAHLIEEPEPLIRTLPPPLPKIYTEYSALENTYAGFNSPEAINALAKMENDHFHTYETGTSHYYGTSWRTFADSIELNGSSTMYGDYLDSLNEKPDSMHCTLYAVKALQKGMDSLWPILENHHTRIYKDHEHAGWSIAHILVKEFGWKAYWITDRYAEEFHHCNASYNRNKEYPVWNQPNIPLEAMYVRDDQDSLITELLAAHEYGWGFSKQGYHTWITRFTDLKECIWYGAPAERYELMGLPLFRTTPFLEYYDYQSHVICFPPKLNQ